MADVARHVLTRRRALKLGAAAGVGTVVAPAAALGAATDRPSSPRSFAMAVRSAAFGAGRRTEVLRAPARFDLVGVAGHGTARAGLQARVRPRGGRWSPWVPLAGGADHAPDRPRRNEASDPVWTGGADELQLRAAGPLPAGGVELRFVAVPAGVGAEVPGLRAQGRAAQAGMPAIISRDVWGAAAVRPRNDPAYGQVQMALVHHTVSANSYEPQDSAGIVLGIAKYHRDSNGWSDIGYNFLVDQFGQVFEGRAGGIEAAVVGAQAQGWNSASTGIATIGTFEAVAFPDAGLRSLVQLLAWKLSLHGVPATGSVALESLGGAENRWPRGEQVTFQRISGHRDGCSTSCPGSALYGQLPAIRQRTAAIVPTAPAPVIGDPKLSATAVSTRATYGADAVVAGKLLDGAGAPLAGVAVSVQKRGSSAWTTVARTTTGGDGSWSARLPWRRAGQLRAAATAVGAQLRSPAVTIAIDPLLQVSRVASRVQAGRGLRVAGRVRPAGTVSVLIERQGSDGAYRRSSVVELRARDGRFGQAVTMRSPGLFRLTVRATADGRTTSAPPVIVRVVREAADVGSSRSGGAASAPGTAPPDTSGGASTSMPTSAGRSGGASA